MTTFTLNETLRNQVLAALDERAARLEREVARGQELMAKQADVPCSEDLSRAVVWNIAALHETNLARLTIGEAEAAEPSAYPEPQAGWQEAELREAFGR